MYMHIYVKVYMQMQTSIHIYNRQKRCNKHEMCISDHIYSLGWYDAYTLVQNE